MSVGRENLAIALGEVISTIVDRAAALQKVADLIKASGNCRWVGLYDVNHATVTVTNVVWSGPGVPEYPSFPITKGLAAAAISTRSTVNVDDISSDPRYLTAFGSTKSEVIVPVLDRTGATVLGTIDVKSQMPNAFGEDVQTFLETCSVIIRRCGIPDF
jgi:L-methionine (R)-S-oxide reductase